MRITLTHELETDALIPGLTVWLSLELEYAITVDRLARELEFDGMQKVRVTDVDAETEDGQPLDLAALNDSLTAITPEWLYAHHADEMAALDEAALEETRDTLDDEAAHEADRQYTEWKENR